MSDNISLSLTPDEGGLTELLKPREFTPEEYVILNRVKDDLRDAESSYISARGIGVTIQSELVKSREVMMQSVNAFQNTKFEDNVLKIGALTKQLTRRKKTSGVRGIISNRVASRTKAANSVVKLTNVVEQNVADLNAALDMMVVVGQDVTKTMNTLWLIMYAINEDIQEHEKKVELSLKDMATDYLHESKKRRLRELYFQYVISQQQMLSAGLIIKSNQDWVHELTDAANQIIPIYQNCVLQEIGLETNRSAAKALTYLRESVNKSLVDMSERVKDNITDLYSAKEADLFEVSTLEQVERNLMDAVYSVKASRGKSVTGTYDALDILSQSYSKLKELE